MDAITIRTSHFLNLVSQNFWIVRVYIMTIVKTCAFRFCGKTIQCIFDAFVTGGFDHRYHLGESTYILGAPEVILNFHFIVR